MIKRYFCIALMFVAVIGAYAKTITYTADNTTDFCNPERGFYDHIEWTIKGDNASSNLTSSYLTAARKSNQTLILRLYYLNNYRAKDIPQNILTQIGNDMALLRQYGCKAIIRFAYDDNTGDGYQDASLTYWKKHLDQLKKVLSDNADVIYVVQAGFLGVWGEWYYSSAGTGTKISATTKSQLIDKLLECVPASRCVQLRTPQFKKDYTGSSSAMTATDAYQNTPKGRLGHHNDAFLSGSNNMGTYANRTTDMNYLATECLYVPNGGETNDDENKYPTYTTGEKAKTEMAQLHYSYLNSGYCESVIAKWKADQSYNEIARNLGYRYQLTTATLPETGAAGKKITVQLNIKNVGYAPLYNERHAYLVFKSSSKTYTVQLASDPRTWQPNGATTAISETVTLPSTMAAGTYTMYLWLPDAAASIADKADFAVRFANSNIWDSTTGYNKLNHTITVTADGGGQGGDDDDDPTPTTPCEYTVDLSTAQTWSGQHEGASVNFSTTNKVLTANYSTNDTWLATGIYFPINQTDVESVEITYKGSNTSSEWTAFEVCLTDGTNIYRDAVADFSIHTDEGWQTGSVSPNSILWTDPVQSASIDGITMTGIILIINPSGVVSGQMQLKDLKVKRKCTATDAPTPQLTDSPTPRFTKIIKNNHLFIRHNSQIYSILGL